MSATELTGFVDMVDDFDDPGLLTTASHIWRTPVKQKVLQDLSAISPAKRQSALQNKIWNLQNPTTPEESHDEEEEQGRRSEDEPAEKELEEEELEEDEQDEGERPRQTASASPSPPNSTPPPTSPSRRRESSLLVRSDTSMGTPDSGTEDDLIKEAGALTKPKRIGSRVAALSGRPRWTLKKLPEADKATSAIMLTAITLDYINEGPPPPDEARDNRLTDDSRMRTIIEFRYRQAFPDDCSVLEAIEIEGVIFPDRDSLTVGKAAGMEFQLKVTSTGDTP